MSFTFFFVWSQFVAVQVEVQPGQGGHYDRASYLPAGRTGQGTQQLHHEVSGVVRLALSGAGQNCHRQPCLRQDRQTYR